MHNRRDFLKLLGMAVGASLSGCGGSGTDPFQTGFGTTPVGYQFVPLVRAGQALPNGKAILSQSTGDGPPFLGGVMINDKRQVAFHALDQSDARGIYRVEASDSGAISDVDKIIGEGDVLSNGTVVDDFSDGDLNNAGDFLVQVENPEGIGSIQYCPEGGNFEKLAEAFQDVSEAVKLSGEICPCQALSDDGRVLYLAEYVDEDGEAEGQGLFIAQVGTPGQPELLFSKNQMLPGSSAAIDTIGALELGAGGRYLALGSAAPIGGATQVPEGTPQTYLVSGQPGIMPQVLAADPVLGVTGTSVLQGSTYMCPRLGTNSIGVILQLDQNKTELRVNQRLLLQADFATGASLSPRGSAIISMFPPVFGPGDLLFLQIFTTDGSEIVVYDGRQFRTILGIGDLVAGKKVADMMFGALPESVNSRGELVAVVAFEDGELVVMLGLPV